MIDIRNVAECNYHAGTKVQFLIQRKLHLSTNMKHAFLFRLQLDINIEFRYQKSIKMQSICTTNCKPSGLSYMRNIWNSNNTVNSKTYISDKL